MTKQSLGDNLGQREQNNDYSQSTSVGPITTPVNKDDISILLQSARRSLGQRELNDDSLSKSNESAEHEHHQQSLLSHDSSSRCSSCESYASDYSNESDSDLSDDDSTILDGVLQMGCLDVFFLPSFSKNRQRRSLVKRNSNGEQELNLKLDGPLAIGLEAEMKKKMEKRPETIQNSGSEVNTRQRNTLRKSEVPLFDDELANDVTKQVRSLMSLSDETSFEDEDGAGSGEIQQASDTNYQRNHHHQKDPQLQELRLDDNVPVSKSDPQKERGHQLRMPQSIASLPSHIVVTERKAFEEERGSMYEMTVAPDPPPSSLPKIYDGSFADTAAIIELGSDSSMVARGSGIDDDDDVVSAPPEESSEAFQPSSSKIGRWRQANNQRLKLNGQMQNATSPVKRRNDKGEKKSAKSSSSSARASLAQEKPARDEPLSRSSTAGPNFERAAADTTRRREPEEAAAATTLAFDSIFSRRIEKRRAAKKLNRRSSSGGEASETGPPAGGGASDAVENDPPSDRKFRGSARRTSSEPGRDAESEFAAIPSDERTNDDASSSGVAASAAAPNAESSRREEPPSASKADEDEDIENRAPPVVVLREEREKKLSAALRSSGEDKRQASKGVRGGRRREEVAVPVRDLGKPKNPFQDDDYSLQEDDDDDDDEFDEYYRYDDDVDVEIYDPEADAYPLLTSSSSDDGDVFVDAASSSSPSSPLRSRRDPASMAPSPRRALAASPRHYYGGGGGGGEQRRKTNTNTNRGGDDDDDDASPATPAAGRGGRRPLERCPSGRLNRADSFKCDDSASYRSLSDDDNDNDLEAEFFDSSMYLAAR